MDTSKRTWRAVGVGVSIGALACLTVAGCGGVSEEVKRLRERGMKFQPALDAFNQDCGRPPTPEEGLEALVENPGTEDIADKWDGPYLKPEDLKDQWGNNYGLKDVRTESGNIVTRVWSPGEDGEFYTSDDVYDPDDFDRDDILPPDEGKP